MFCTGAAPVVPGISARFSSPGRPWSMVQATSSCHGTPAPASTMKASLRVSSSRMPPMATFSTTAETSRASTMLLPPPSTNFGARPNSG